MKLSKQDAKLFLDLMWSLQFYVNGELEIYPDIESVDEYKALPSQKKLEVRDALYENLKLIDSFVRENPQDLSGEELAIVAGWKKCVTGDFYIERFLKKYAILLHGDDVYAVLGLYKSFDEMIHRSRLPLYIQTALLPFKGKIVFDGLFQGYNVYFGSSLKGNLKEVYMRAKQNGRIIDTLEPAQKKKKKPDKPVKNWTPELNKLAVQAKKLRGTRQHPPLCSPSFSLVKASIEFAQLASSKSKDPDEFYTSYKKINRALKKLHTVLDREEF